LWFAPGIFSNDLWGALQASNSAWPSEKGMIHHLAEFIITGDNFTIAVKKKGYYRQICRSDEIGLRQRFRLLPVS
jgi:hypothetical protein